MPGGKYRNAPPESILPRVSAPIDGRRNCMRIVDEALAKGYWIYDPSTRNWYSPEEFKKAFDRFHTGFDEFFAQCQVRDPQDGFNAGLVIIQRMIDDVAKFVNRIVKYYKTH